jgi:hypothetical protein
MKMKITVTKTHTEEVDIQLPFFGKKVTSLFTDYFAIYSEDSKENIELCVRSETGKLWSLHSFRSPDVSEHDNITEAEFKEAYEKALLTLPFVAQLNSELAHYKQINAEMHIDNLQESINHSEHVKAFEAK